MCLTTTDHLTQCQILCFNLILQKKTSNGSSQTPESATAPAFFFALDFILSSGMLNEKYRNSEFSSQNSEYDRNECDFLKIMV
jgi:hypothetical protein